MLGKHRKHSILKDIIGMLDLTKLYPVERAVLEAAGRKRISEGAVDHIITSGEYMVPVRMYPRKNARKLMIYIHGGGWATESIDTYDGVCRSISEELHCHVISVEYSLSPEKKFPYALNECIAVITEVQKNIRIFGLSEEDIVLCGDSAGGNLAAAACTLLRDRENIPISKLILLYPVTGSDYSEDSPFESVHTKGKGYTLTARHMRDYVILYMNTPEDLKSPYFTLLNGTDYSDMPDTLIFTAENDPLCSEGTEYAHRLAKAGNHVKHYRVRGASHGFFKDHRSKASAKARKIMRDFLKGGGADGGK